MCSTTTAARWATAKAGANRQMNRDIEAAGGGARRFSISLLMPLLFALFFCFVFSPAHSQQIAVRLADADSLRLPAEMSLERLVGRLEEQLAGIDRPLLIERRWMLVESFYRYEDGRRELTLLDSVRVNLRRIYLLNRQLAGKGEISDTQVLTSHNSYLRAELEYLATERTIRDAILTIVRLANLDLSMNPKDQSDGRIPKKANAETPD